MKLKRLIVQGFKSFKDRTVIHFDEGITGIVGPNGCGKSNIVDALFWVMGEQSAKHLRGSSMQDVIFAGSSKYKPGTWAEASLVLENDEGKHIHIGNKVACPSEIMLTRKLYRNGETEYRINDVPARLKDIQEVFMDTGAGAKSYSIIAQGEINRLVQAKPVERRVMIEEVAGITKFKIRKRESMKKIEATQSNLARLQDLQVEIEKNLRSLQKQAEKAERARSLKERVRRYDLIVNSHKEFDLLKNYRDGKNIIGERQLQLAEWKTKKDQLEVDLESERFKKEEMTEKVEEMQKEFNEISKTLAGAEERLKFLTRSRSEKEKLIDSKEKEIEVLQTEMSERRTKLEEISAQFESLKNSNLDQEDFAAHEDKVSFMKDELDALADETNTARTDIENFRLDLTKIDQDIFKNNSKLEEYNSNLQDITKEIQELEGQYSGFLSEVKTERIELEDLEEKFNNSDSLEKNTKAKIAELKLELTHVELEYKAKTKEQIQVDSKLSSLKEINASLEEVKIGTKEFLHSDLKAGFELFGTLIQCEEKYTKVVQLLLSDIVNTIAISTGNVENLATWIKEQNWPAIEVLIAQEGTANLSDLAALQAQGINDAVELSDIIQLPADYAHYITLFKGHFVSDNFDLEVAQKISPAGFKAIASTDAKFYVSNIGNGKVLTVTNPDSLNGMVSRNNQIAELETKSIELETTTRELEAHKHKIEQEYEKQVNELENIRSTLIDAKANYAAKKSTFEAKQKNFEVGNSRLNILKSRKSEISKARLDSIESEDTLQQKLVATKKSLEDKQALLTELTEKYQIQKAQYDEQKEELLEKQVIAKNYHQRLEQLGSQVKDITEQLEKQTTRLETNNQFVETYSAEIDQMTTEEEELKVSNSDLASGLRDKEEVLNYIKDDFAELLTGMQEREDEVRKLTRNVSQTEKDLVEYEIKLGQFITEEEQIVRNIFEKYKIDLRDTMGKYLEFSEEDYSELRDVDSMFVMETENGPTRLEAESYEFVRRYGQDLKEAEQKFRNYRQEFNTLGEVNWQAIEDYDRQKLRFDFLSEQEKELKESLINLENAIKQIDEKSKARFKLAYEEVNERFLKVFPIIFGGGNAHLKIIGDLDDPECGIDIIAQPPGKKMQNINLMSGGEKAMTAVSLIFSIFLVKPSPFCLLDEVDAPLDDANVGRFNELLKEMSKESQFILITHNKKTMELNDTLYGVTMQEPGVSKAVCVQLQ